MTHLNLLDLQWYEPRFTPLYREPANQTVLSLTPHESVMSPIVPINRALEVRLTEEEGMVGGVVTSGSGASLLPPVALTDEDRKLIYSLLQRLEENSIRRNQDQEKMRAEWSMLATIEEKTPPLQTAVIPPLPAVQPPLPSLPPLPVASEPPPLPRATLSPPLPVMQQSPSFVVHHREKVLPLPPSSVVLEPPLVVELPSPPSSVEAEYCHVKMISDVGIVSLGDDDDDNSNNISLPIHKQQSDNTDSFACMCFKHPKVK